MSTTRKNITEGTTWLTLSKVAAQVISVCYLFVLLSNLSLHEYGLIKLAFSIPLLLGLFSLTGITPVLISDLSGHKEANDITKIRYTLSSVVSLKYLLGVTAAVGLFVATFVAEDWFFEDTLMMVRLLAIVFLTGPIYSLILLSFSLRQRFGQLAFFSFTEELLKFAMVVLFVAVFDLGALGVIAGYVLTELLVILIFFFSILSFRTEWLEGRLFSRGLVDPLYCVRSHAKWAVLLGGVTSFNTNIRVWLIQFVLGTHAVAIYSLALTLIQPIINLLPVSSVIAPILPSYKTKPQSLSRLVNAAVKYRILFQVIAIAATALVLPFLLQWLFPEYLPAFGLFVALAIAMLPKFCSQIISLLSHLFQLQKNLLTGSVFNLLLVSVTLPISLYFFGIYGAAIELFITQAIFLIGRYRVVKKTTPGFALQFKDFYTITDIDRWLFTKIKNRFLRMVPLGKK